MGADGNSHMYTIKPQQSTPTHLLLLLLLPRHARPGQGHIVPGSVCAHAGEIVPAQAKLRGGGVADGAAGIGGEKDGEVPG